MSCMDIGNSTIGVNQVLEVNDSLFAGIGLSESNRFLEKAYYK